MDDFKGKKVRVFGTAMADYMKELGAVTVNIPFVEVLPAMQQGVADCGITSPANGNGARWLEVTKDLLIMPVGGWGIGFFAANLDWWNGLSPDTQAFLQAEFKKLEDRQWQQAAYDLKDGVSCNTGAGSLRVRHQGGCGQADARHLPDRSRQDPSRPGHGLLGPEELGQALRRGMRCGVERHHRQGGRPAGPDAVTGPPGVIPWSRR